MSNCIEVSNLNLLIRDEKILNNINFKVPFGKTLAIVGESGAGKSMIAQSIVQCLPQATCFSNSTSIKLDGSELTELSERDMCRVRGKEIGLIFQDALSALNPVKSIGSQLTEALLLHTDMLLPACKQKIIQLLSNVGIKDPEACYAAYPHQLSGGMLQRALIASVLALEPKLLIADEPTTALDVTVQAKLIKLLSEIQNSYNCAMIFISHDLMLVREIADYVLVLKGGDLVEYDEAGKFFNNPATEYSRKLLISASPVKEMLSSFSSVNILEVLAMSVKFPKPKSSLLGKREYNLAVDKVSLKIKKSSTLALVGESGSGKSSLAKALLGIYPSTGKCYWCASVNPKKDISVVFQNPFSSMNPRLTIREILTELWQASTFPEDWEQRAEQALLKVGLSAESLGQYPHQFSGGERQRICIARAIIGNPKVIILDEPTSALDVSIQAVISDLLIKLQEMYGYTYLLITHDFLVVKKMAHDVAVMQNGKIVESGEVGDILYSPVSDYTKDLIAAIPGF